MMMRELRARHERAALLPGGSDELFMVLFWRSSDPAGAALRRVCAEVVWPRCYQVVAVDLDIDADVDAWFGSPSIPMLAVVTDGSMLCMEYEATTDACRALADCGVHQYSMLKSMSA